MQTINVRGTLPENLKFYAKVLELYYGQGLSQRQVVDKLGISKGMVQMIVKKYKPIQGNRNIIIVISSELDSERAISNEKGWSERPA